MINSINSTVNQRPHKLSFSRFLFNIGTQAVQEFFFFCEISEIGAFMELSTVMIWLIRQVILVALYSKKLGIYDVRTSYIGNGKIAK